jgi:hypothetical protein
VVRRKPKIAYQGPEVLAMVLADNVHRDNGNGKFTILGTYKIIGGISFPLAHPAIIVYVELTDGRGKTPLQLRLVDANELRDPVFVQDGEIDFLNPLQIYEIVFFQMGPILFTEPGEYRLQLFIDGEFLKERRVFAVEVGKQPSG